MLSLGQLFLTLVIILLAAIMKWYKRPFRFPPGPRGVPLLGVFLFTRKNHAVTYKKWSLEKYGAVMSLNTGTSFSVVLNTYNVINEVYVKKGQYTSGKRPSAVFKKMFKERGILFRNYSEQYKRQKAFGLKALRSFGFKKRDMENTICKQASDMIEFLKKDCGSPIDILHTTHVLLGGTIKRTYPNQELLESLQGVLRIILGKVVPRLNETSASVIGVMVFGQDFNVKDEKCTTMLDNIRSLLYEQKDMFLLAVFVFEWLSRLPPFSNTESKMVQQATDTLDILQAFVDEHKASFDPNNIRDFIDAYIYEQKFGDGKDQPGFDEEQLIVLIHDLFAAGTETTASSLYWAIATLLNFPQYEELMIEEIQNFVGVGEPSLQHRNKLPITSAFLQEAWRVNPPAHLVIHATHRPVEVNGYIIPRNTRVMANLWGANHDPETWSDPHKFDPYRHINEAGEFVHSSKIIPFSIGPRSCLGESLARNEYFLIFVKLMQSFRFRQVGDTPPPLDDSVGVIVQQPKPFQVILEER